MEQHKIHKDNNEYVYTLVHNKLNGTEDPSGKSHRIVRKSFGLRCINSATKLGEKNPTEIGRFLSTLSRSFVLIIERKFLELFSNT